MSKYNKIIQICNVSVAFVVGFCSRVILEFLSTFLGVVSKAYSIESIRHGIPIALGLLTFSLLQFHPKIKKWMFEVVTEVDKVVWPTKKDTLSMTLVVSVILLLSGIVLGIFDLSAGTVVKFIMN